MSSESIQSQIEFILEHQARFSEDIQLLKEVQSLQAENINELSKVTASLSETTAATQAHLDATQAHLDSVISEMRDAFSNLILSNEVTRDLANKIASLEV
jgi:signal transduction histidine kinase